MALEAGERYVTNTGLTTVIQSAPTSEQQGWLDLRNPALLRYKLEPFLILCKQRFRLEEVLSYYNNHEKLEFQQALGILDEKQNVQNVNEHGVLTQVTRPSFVGADLDGYDLQGADLQGAQMQGAILQGATMQGAALQGANLQGAQMQGAILQWAALQEADLREADLQKAQMRGAGMQRAILRGATMQEATMQGAILWDAQMQGAQMQGATMRKTQMQGAQMQGSILEGADLERADLRRAQMQGADLQGAQMQGADLRGADLSLTDLSGANFYNAKNLNTVILTNAFYDAANPPLNLPENILALDGESYEKAKKLQAAYREALVSDNEATITAAETALTTHLEQCRKENAKKALKENFCTIATVFGGEAISILVKKLAGSAVTVTGDSPTTAASPSDQQDLSLDDGNIDPYSQYGYPALQR